MYQRVKNRLDAELLSEDWKYVSIKKATRTFKLAKNFKAYTYDGYMEKYYKISKSDVGKGYNGGKVGLTFILTVKNGKVTRIDFYS